MPLLKNQSQHLWFISFREDHHLLVIKNKTKRKITGMIIRLPLLQFHSLTTVMMIMNSWFFLASDALGTKNTRRTATCPPAATTDRWLSARRPSFFSFRHQNSSSRCHTLESKSSRSKRKIQCSWGARWIDPSSSSLFPRPFSKQKNDDADDTLIYILGDSKILHSIFIF